MQDESPDEVNTDGDNSDVTVILDEAGKVSSVSVDLSFAEWVLICGTVIGLSLLLKGVL